MRPDHRRANVDVEIDLGTLSIRDVLQRAGRNASLDLKRLRDGYGERRRVVVVPPDHPFVTKHPKESGSIACRIEGRAETARRREANEIVGIELWQHALQRRQLKLAAAGRIRQVV